MATDRITKRAIFIEVAIFAVVAAALLSILYKVSPAARLYLGIPADVWRTVRAEKYLVNEADHELLLEECRELMRKYPDEDMQSGDPRLHEVFADVKAIGVYVKKDYAVVSLHGAFHHCGAFAFAEGAKEHGDRKLIDGLWFYSD